MNKKQGLRIICLMLSLILLIGVLPATALAVEPAGKFILVVEAGGELVVAPEYITYTEGQTIGDALINSGHTFTGIEQGQVTAVDDVTGNFTRSDQNGGYDLTTPAASVTHYCFSERASSESKPNDGIMLLMTAMADYLIKDTDVQKAAKAEYDAAKEYFVGCNSDDARTLAYDLNTAVAEYEAALGGTHHTISFTDGSKIYSVSNYPGVTIKAENPYGKSWTDDGDGNIDLPVGNYSFCVEQTGLRVEGTIAVSAAASVTVQLPSEPWLKLDTFRLSGSYGADDNTETRFVDGEFEVGQWEDRHTNVAVEDLFTGA
ncbi:MAG: hypothetical protein IKL36_03880, partial [Clostridia bacterium]|nr:hypothetical protein [Clostridia bacterium]